jgi:hypothetical protein
LAQAIRGALDQPELAAARRTALLERAKKLFSASRMAHDVTRFYGDLSQARAKHLGLYQSS